MYSHVSCVLHNSGRGAGGSDEGYCSHRPQCECLKLFRQEALQDFVSGTMVPAFWSLPVFSLRKEC